MFGNLGRIFRPMLGPIQHFGPRTHDMPRNWRQRPYMPSPMPYRPPAQQWRRPPMMYGGNPWMSGGGGGYGPLPSPGFGYGGRGGWGGGTLGGFANLFGGGGRGSFWDQVQTAPPKPKPKPRPAPWYSQTDSVLPYRRTTQRAGQGHLTPDLSPNNPMHFGNLR